MGASVLTRSWMLGCDGRHVGYVGQFRPILVRRTTRGRPAKSLLKGGDMVTPDDLWPALEALGEEEVRKRLAQGVYGERKLALVKEWLATKGREREQAVTKRQEVWEETGLELAEEANKIATEANMISRRSNVVAWCPLVVSILSVLFSAVALWLGGR